MKSSYTERGIVLILFMLVIITFTLAEKDSHNLDKLYKKTSVQKLDTSNLKLSFNKNT